VRINIGVSLLILMTLVSTRTTGIACHHSVDKWSVIERTTLAGSDPDDYDAALRLLTDRGTTPASTPLTEALALVDAAVLNAHSDADSDAATLLAALTVLRHLRDQLSSWEPQLITAARHAGVSWIRLAPALGVTSRQAAERRYLRLRPSATGEPTAEGRVRAERDKRAADRAVATWARDNAATLRQLAAQISTLDDLTAPAQHHANLVGKALANNDPTTLLAPMPLI
jgi:hypothetical protein